ncbi:SAM-dependent methyltransferase [Plastoroseomonas arctica]|uniref:Class I SAM-dependent methyltransferase n=1 Tax=Plastoroseomonas arctica TaxID=1509237 RepID=A0AAF1K346_9PROT|nr:cyclopropane-fatty-acyl-phospholipid synthase family protein [Plastoroseomonas arctica]MBR0655536.1 class I SAM-dependent methyltransferase [Plastoroseomonas arctica]
MRLLSNLLTRFIRNGQMRLIDAEGTTHVFGGQGPGPVVTLRISDPKLYNRIALNPELHAGEAYMDGTLTFEDGSDVGDFMTLFSYNRSGLASAPSQQLLRSAWRGLKRWHQANPLGKAAENARHHYDLKTELYRLFLDAGLNYSCAFFEHPETDTLEQAQEAKLARITAKLAAKPGMVVAEVGSGWGSMAIHIAKTTGARVVAINVSPEQIRVARDRAEEAGVAGLVEFRELDYRVLEGRFDRVVSVGMMEHVGIGNFDAYFGKIRSLLTDDGFAMVHCIGRMRPPGTTGPFIRKYIFPGGYVPSLSEVFAATERMGLWVADMEVLRLHYHYTLQHWRRRFAANRAQAAALYDERFCRMWEWYLAAVDVGFQNGSNMVFQLLLSSQVDAVPIVRDYMMRPAMEPAAE